MQDEIEQAVAGLSPVTADIMREMMLGKPADWTEVRHFRDRIVEAHRATTSEKDRVALLFAFHALMDDVLQSDMLDNEAKTKLEGLKKADHRLMVMTEASGPDGIVFPDRLLAVVEREVEAGRMEHDNDYRTLAAAGAQVLGSKSTKRRSGFLSRLFAK